MTFIPAWEKNLTYRYAVFIEHEHAALTVHGDVKVAITVCAHESGAAPVK